MSAMPAASRHGGGRGPIHEPLTKPHSKVVEQQAAEGRGEVQLEGLTAHQIRQLLDARGISHKDCKALPELIQRALYHGVGTA